ncbi:MAG: DUF1549 and DUF1553 domain-containing protein, partial [Bryobacteraceae bacterium]
YGSNPEADYEMLVKKADGRRIDRANPAKSLLLLKPTLEVKHGGGKRFEAGSSEYAVLSDWIAAGARRDPASERRMTSLQVFPKAAVLFGDGARRRLLVRARYSDGSESDVTGRVNYFSNDASVATVSAEGWISAKRGGETAIVVRGPGVLAASKIGVVTKRRQLPEVHAANFVDEHVFAKLKQLHIPASEIADDSTFLRRAYLDIIGVIPSADEARAFLADKDPGKRAKLVDVLLQRPEYADYWALYWGDHLGNTSQLIYGATHNFTPWLNDIFRRNVPYDEFVRRLLTSDGDNWRRPANSFYHNERNALDYAAVTSQLFLGVSIECARCHDHPLEKWKQEEYNGMAAFFGQLKKKKARRGATTFNYYLDFEKQFEHPETKKVTYPKPLDGPVMLSDKFQDRRRMLADWMIAPENPFFARAIANRMWRNFMGRGVVEPVDDFRATNPPTNEGLLAALADDFVKHGYDLHHLIRRITASNAYQLSAVANEGNKGDDVAYSRYYTRRLIAEQMLDSISLATGVPEKFPSMHLGTRAAQLPDVTIPSYFLETFERPSRQQVCERKKMTSLNQALHLISGDTLDGKIMSPKGVLLQMLEARRASNEIVEELYLRTLSRYPDREERDTAEEAVRRAASPRKGLQNLFWALLNSKEFLYNH